MLQQEMEWSHTGFERGSEPSASQRVHSVHRPKSVAILMPFPFRVVLP